tara:strand:+ start:1174 stop:2850 length:1677 start_codon:yes stop_codon:yes gene_type:complete
MYKFLFLITFIILHQDIAKAKKPDPNNFNQKYLSNYFSAIISAKNQNDLKAISYFNNSKNLIKFHKNFLENYVFSLVSSGRIRRSIVELKKFNSENLDIFFEGHLILFIDSINNKNFEKADSHLRELSKFQNNDTYQIIITETLRSYLDLFTNKKIIRTNKDFGKLSLITNAFQLCYLNSKNSNNSFLDLINSEDGDYSRYLFFYLQNIIKNKEYSNAKNISSTINLINSNLLVSQSKIWIDTEQFSKFNNIFTCKNEKHLISEFLYLIANLLSSQEEFKQSNFYLNLSSFLNPGFYFNNSLIAENYFLSENFKKSENILNMFRGKDIIYDWFRIKKITQIISVKEDKEKSLQFMSKSLKMITDPNYKILYDVANIYKNFEKYSISISYYNAVLSKLDKNTETYADTLYRRGSSFERLKDYSKSDRDLLESLSIIENDPYVLNYLAYSWLERNYNLDISIDMLIKAHKQKKDNPYITDSLGWAYYLKGEFETAEKYMVNALQLKPNDPVIMDHYGDVLWKLKRKLEARYLWSNAINSEENHELDVKYIKQKILLGLKK